MKEQMKRIVSILLVAFMLASSCGTVFASQDNDSNDKSNEVVTPVLNYVSFGDSMTNGYGLPGYNAGENDDIGVNGYLQNDTNAYPSQFAQFLRESLGKEVNHTQLAISCMRAEDLHFILEYDYNNEELNDFVERTRSWSFNAWTQGSE